MSSNMIVRVNQLHTCKVFRPGKVPTLAEGLLGTNLKWYGRMVCGLQHFPCQLIDLLAFPQPICSMIKFPMIKKESVVAVVSFYPVMQTIIGLPNIDSSTCHTLVCNCKLCLPKCKFLGWCYSLTCGELSMFIFPYLRAAVAIVMPHETADYIEHYYYKLPSPLLVSWPW